MGAAMTSAWRRLRKEFVPSALISAQVAVPLAGNRPTGCASVPSTLSVACGPADRVKMPLTSTTVPGARFSTALEAMATLLVMRMTPSAGLHVTLPVMLPPMLVEPRSHTMMKLVVKSGRPPASTAWMSGRFSPAFSGIELDQRPVPG